MNLISDQEQLHIFTSFPATAQDDDTAELLDKQQSEPQSQPPNKLYSFWQIEFYQKYFNVNTNDVLYRIFGSMVPTLSNTYLNKHIRPNPDLYGPFWVAITLIFTISIAGNIVNYFQTLGNNEWTTDFNKVTSASAAILLYWWCVPTLLYFLMSWRQFKGEYTFLELLCVYGYSLSIFIPVTFLWLIQVNLFQWILLLLAVLLSGTVLVLTFFPAFSNDKYTISIPIMAMIFILHGLLAVLFMLYFFHVPASSIYPVDATTTATTTTTILTTTLGNLTKIK